MRIITTHHTNDANKAIVVEADNRNPDNGNASHTYRFHYLSRSGEAPNDYLFADNQRLSFQNGPIGDVGINGITNEVLLAIVIDRLEGFQSSKWANEYNAHALAHVYDALGSLEARTKERVQRGVEGTHKV